MRKALSRRGLGVRVLAGAGFLAGILGALGGALGSVEVVGVGSAVMLIANVIAFFASEEKAPPVRVVATGEAAPALAAIVAEYERALGKFPAPFNSNHEGAAVLMEEVDEFWDAVKSNQDEHARAEAVQVGAMALRYLVQRPARVG